MRLIRSKIYRAFPELDRFSDDQCVRFVVSANSSLVSRVVRWVLVGCVGVVSLVAALIATGLTMERYDPSGNRDWGVAVEVLVFVPVVAVGFVLSLIARDVLLRWRVRRVIREGGTCVKCQYSLLGIRVGEDLMVQCPECGMRRRVDPALGELVTDESGARVYRPVGAWADDEEQLWRSASRRRLFKRAGIVGGTLALLVVLAAGGVWGFVWMQARAARKGGPGVALAAETAALHLGGRGLSGALSDEEREREWGRFLDVLDAASSLVGAIEADPAFGGGGPQAWLVPEVLYEETDLGAFERSHGAGTFDRSRAMVRSAVSRCAAEGVGAKLRGLLEMGDPLRPVPGPAYGYEMMGLGQAHNVSRLQLVRMAAAMRDGDRGAYLEALGGDVRVIRGIARQGTLADRMTAMQIRSALAGQVLHDAPRMADRAWADAAMARMAEARQMPALGSAIESSNVMMRETIRNFFADESTVLLAMGGAWPQQYRWPGAPTLEPLKIGTYWGNIAACNRMGARIVEQANLESSARSGVNVATGFPLVDMSMSWYGQCFTQDDSGEREYRRAMVGLAGARFRLANGREAATVEELASLLPDAKTGIDPFTNRAFVMEPGDVGADGKAGAMKVVAPSDGAGNDRGETRGGTR